MTPPISSKMMLGYWRKPFPLRRLLIPTSALLLIGAMTVTIRYGPEWWGRYLYVSGVRRLQAQCLRYTAPPERVVYDTDPAHHRELLNRPGYQPFNQWSVFTVPDEWHSFRGGYACPDGTAFLHGRKAGPAAERLVSVDIIPASANVVWLRWGVSDRASYLDLPGVERARKTVGRTTVRLDSHQKPLRLYAGQIDPHDPAAFSIHGSFGSEPFVIQGKLLDDGSVQLQPDTTSTAGAPITGITSYTAGPEHTWSDMPDTPPACAVSRH